MAKKSHGVLIGLILGVAGFLVGILAAPKSGKDTRDTIVKDGKKAVSTAKKAATTVVDRAVEVKTRSQQAVDGAKQSYKKPVSKKKK